MLNERVISPPDPPPANPVPAVIDEISPVCQAVPSYTYNPFSKFPTVVVRKKIRPTNGESGKVVPVSISALKILAPGARRISF